MGGGRRAVGGGRGGADAIMGVTFFSDAKPEYFAVFDRSLITMFRITSGEAWADYMPPLDDDGSVNFGTCVFFVSYTVIVCWTLLQVFPAIGGESPPRSWLTQRMLILPLLRALRAACRIASDASGRIKLLQRDKGLG